MRRISERDSTHGHVSVADGFDFFQFVLFGYSIELTETTIEFLNELLWREAFSYLREANEISEKHGRLLIIDRLHSIGLLQFLSNRFGQDAPQQPIRFPSLLVEVLRKNLNQNPHKDLDKQKVSSNVDESLLLICIACNPFRLELLKN